MGHLYGLYRALQQPGALHDLDRSASVPLILNLAFSTVIVVTCHKHSYSVLTAKVSTLVDDELLHTGLVFPSQNSLACLAHCVQIQTDSCTQLVAVSYWLAVLACMSLEYNQSTSVQRVGTAVCLTA